MVQSVIQSQDEDSADADVTTLGLGTPVNIPQKSADSPIDSKAEILAGKTEKEVKPSQFVPEKNEMDFS